MNRTSSLPSGRRFGGNEGGEFGCAKGSRVVRFRENTQVLGFVQGEFFQLVFGWDSKRERNREGSRGTVTLAQTTRLWRQFSEN